MAEISRLNRKTRVLEVIYGFGYGGIRAFIMNYLQLIDKDKFDVDIYVFGFDSSPFTEKVQQLGFNIYFEPENNSQKIFKFVHQIYSFIKHNGPYDVVHAHNNLISAWVLLAAKMANVPVRLPHSHSTSHFGKSIFQNYYSRLRKSLINKLATKKLACGQLAGESMYGFSATFDVVANGIDLNKFLIKDKNKINDLRAKFNIPKGVKVYANVTRLDPQKNHLFAVDIFNEILKREKDSVFIYGGVEPKISSTAKLIEEKIRQYGIQANCRFTGPIMDIESLYHLSDAWLYCSNYEGLPFGPLELQAAGIPVLASSVITKEIDLGLGLVSFLSLEDGPEIWAQKAISLKKKDNRPEDVYKAFGQHNFDIRQNVKHLEAIYQGDI